MAVSASCCGLDYFNMANSYLYIGRWKRQQDLLSESVPTCKTVSGP